MGELGQLWGSMAVTGKAIIALLGLLSVYSLAVVVERELAVRWSKARSRAFARQAVQPGHREAAALLALAEGADYRGFSSLASVVASGLRAFVDSQRDGERGDALMEAVGEGTRSGAEVAIVNLRARLTGLATIAGVAPFLGLFGTVTGLITAFRGIATSGGGGLAAVSSGVSEALVTTVLGLFVAMPALWAYNFFMHRIDVIALELNSDAARLVGQAARREARPTGAKGLVGKRDRRRLAGRPRLSALPDVTPIVNIALVLLIIFMIVTPMVREGIQVDTPEALSVEQLAESDQSVVLAIRDDGSLYVNLKPVDLATLQSELGLAYVGNEGKAVVIKGAQSLPYSEVLRVMDVCKSIGAPAVDLVAKKAK